MTTEQAQSVFAGERRMGQGDIALPEGWEIAEYPGKGGRPHFAVFSHGRRMASGMTSLQSAARWASLLISSKSGPAA